METAFSATAISALCILAFDLEGSLDHLGSDYVGPLARESLADYVGSQMQPIGPFTSYENYLVAEPL